MSGPHSTNGEVPDVVDLSDVDAERRYLGAALMSPVMVTYHDGLEPQSFYRNDHRSIYRAIATVATAGDYDDERAFSAVAEELRRAGDESQRLFNLATELLTVAEPLESTDATAKHLVDLAFRRKVLRLGYQIDQAVAGIDDPERLKSRVKALTDFVIGEPPGLTPAEVSSEEPPPVSEYDVEPVSAAVLEEPGPRAWVVRELIPAKWPTILFGDGGVGKTTISNHLACCVATGTPWFGREPEPCAVLVVDAELDREEFARRMWPIARGLGLSEPPKNVYYWKLPKAISRDDVQRRLAYFIARLDIGLLIVDSLTLATHLSDQNAAGDISSLIFTINQQGVATFLIDHHARLRAEADDDTRVDPYGSVMKRNLSRSSIYVTEYGEGLIRLRPNKVSFTAKWEPFVVEVRFSPEAITYGQVATNDPRLIVAKSRDINEQLVDAVQDCMESDDTMRRLGVSTDILYPILKPIFPELTEAALRMRCIRLVKVGRLLKTGDKTYALPTLLPTSERTL